MTVKCIDMQLEVEVVTDKNGEISEVYSNAVPIKHALKKSQLLWLKQELEVDDVCFHERLNVSEEDVICRECGEHAPIESCEDCRENFGTSCCNALGRF